jgi:hypothetical protein
LIIGGYTPVVQGRRVAVEDATDGLTVRIPNGICGLRVVEMIGVRYGAQLQRLYVALPGEADRAGDEFSVTQFGSTLTDLRELHWLHRQPGCHNDIEEDAFPGVPDVGLWLCPRLRGQRIGSVSQLIISVAKTLQVLELRCGIYMQHAHFTTLIQVLPRSLRRVVVDLTPFRSHHTLFRSRTPALSRMVRKKPSYTEITEHVFEINADDNSTLCSYQGSDIQDLKARTLEMARLMLAQFHSLEKGSSAVFHHESFAIDAGQVEPVSYFEW